MSLRVEGHLTSKSSPLAPVSCKLSQQFIVQQHLNAHYKNINNVKSSIDNKCPKSWYKHTNVKDQIKKERLLKSARENNRESHSPALYPSRTTRSEFDDDNITPSTDRMCYESIKPLGPRIYKGDAKSKIAQLRCYNPPKKKVVVRGSVAAPTMAAPPIQMETEKKYQQSESVPEKIEETDLGYLNFCNDFTNDILKQNIYTNRGINQIFDDHVTKNKYKLKMDTMLKAYDNIRIELVGKVDMSKNSDFNSEKKDFNYHRDRSAMKSFESHNEFGNRQNYFLSPENDNDINHFSSGNYESFQSYLDEDKKYISSVKNNSLYDNIDDDIEHIPTVNHENYESYLDEDKIYLASLKNDSLHIDKSLDNISPKHALVVNSSAPLNSLQWSLTSMEDFENISKIKAEQEKIKNIDELCEDIYDIKIKDNQPEIIDKQTDMKTDNDQSYDINYNKNVHFANHNEVFSAIESDDHSLTDVTSMRMGESDDDDDDDNNDSTCVESSLDLNNTFKSDLTKHDINVTKYEDDFDD